MLSTQGGGPLLFQIYVYICIFSWKYYIFIYLHDILRSSYICRISELCMSWLTSNQFYFAPCLTCREPFGSVMCNRASCAQVHGILRGHWRIGINRGGILSVFLTTNRNIYYISPQKPTLEASFLNLKTFSCFMRMLTQIL